MPGNLCNEEIVETRRFANRLHRASRFNFLGHGASTVLFLGLSISVHSTPRRPACLRVMR